MAGAATLAKPFAAGALLLAGLAAAATQAPAQSSRAAVVPTHCASAPAVNRLRLEAPGTTETLFHSGAEAGAQMFVRKWVQGRRSERGFIAYGLCGLVELWRGEEPPGRADRHGFRIHADRDFPLRAGSTAGAAVSQPGRADQSYELVSHGRAQAPAGAPPARLYEIAYQQGPNEIARALWSEELRWPVAYHAGTRWQVNVRPDEAEAETQPSEDEKPQQRFQPDYGRDRD